MTEFFAMGGYAFFVWTSMALTALVLILNIVIPSFTHKRLVKELSGSYRREAKHKKS